jgi:hypothetical protein
MFSNVDFCRTRLLLQGASSCCASCWRERLHAVHPAGGSAFMLCSQNPDVFFGTVLETGLNAGRGSLNQRGTR